MRSRRGKLLWVLVAGALLLGLVAVATGAIYFILRQRQSGTGEWIDPIATISPDEIEPGLALYPLAGSSEVETVDAALDGGDLETAYATLVFSTDLQDVQRIGRLVLLGERFAQQDEVDRADLVYQQVYDVAVLSATLNDPARADALLAAGSGWSELGQGGKALETYDQVYLIATESPYLQMAQRRDLLTVLEAGYHELGNEDLAQSARDRNLELEQQSSPQPPAHPVESPNLKVGTTPISSPELGALEESRRQAAYALIASLPDGEAPPPDLVSNLAQALQTEDVAKLAFYEQELAAASQLGRRVDLHWQLIRWLTLKYRVASKGFGLTVVPEWEAAAPEIQSMLAKAYEDLLFDYEDLVAGLPEASMVAPGSYDGRREGILAGRLGQYPNYPAEQLAGKLQDAVAQMIDTGYVMPLYVDAQNAGGGLSFFLNTVDDYGRTGESP